MMKKYELEKLATNINLILNSSQRVVAFFNTNADVTPLIVENLVNEMINSEQRILLIHNRYDEESSSKDTVLIRNAKEISKIISLLGNNPQNGLDKINLQMNSKEIKSIMKAILPTLKSMYDLVIFDIDSPLDFADSRVICNMVDGVIMLIDQPKTLRSDIRETIEVLKLANANLLGYVICS